MPSLTLALVCMCVFWGFVLWGVAWEEPFFGDLHVKLGIKKSKEFLQHLGIGGQDRNL